MGSVDGPRVASGSGPRRPLTWAGLILLVVTGLVAIGVGLEGLVGYRGGWLFILSAPIAGLTAGLLAGWIAVRHRVAILGALAVVGGFVAGLAIGWTMWSLPTVERASMIDASPVFTGIPLAVGYVARVAWTWIPARARAAILESLDYLR